MDLVIVYGIGDMQPVEELAQDFLVFLYVI